MSNTKTPQDWKDEYHFFLDSPRRAPPENVSSQIKKSVSVELNPSHLFVVAKLFAIHMISGAITLFFCPQFGVNFHSQAESLYGIFSWLGEYGCMIACGAFFLGATGLSAAVILKAPEVRVIRKTRGLQWIVLSFVSVGFFLAFQEQERSIPVGLVVSWIFGALLGGLSVFRIGYELKSRVRSHFVSGRLL